MHYGTLVVEVARKHPGRRNKAPGNARNRRRKRTQQARIGAGIAARVRRESATRTRESPGESGSCVKNRKRECQESSSRNRGPANQVCDPSGGVERTMWPRVHLMNMAGPEGRLPVLSRCDAPNSFLSFVRLTSHAFDRTWFAAPRLVEICGIRESPLLGSALSHSNTASSLCS